VPVLALVSLRLAHKRQRNDLVLGTAAVQEPVVALVLRAEAKHRARTEARDRDVLLKPLRPQRCVLGAGRSVLFGGPSFDAAEGMQHADHRQK
jgi:hypothetical protein